MWLRRWVRRSILRACAFSSRLSPATVTAGTGVPVCRFVVHGCTFPFAVNTTCTATLARFWARVFVNAVRRGSVAAFDPAVAGGWGCFFPWVVVGGETYVGCVAMYVAENAGKGRGMCRWIIGSGIYGAVSCVP